MKTIQKIEKLGYKVIYLSGSRNGEQTITGVVGENSTTGRRTEKHTCVTHLYKALKK